MGNAVKLGGAEVVFGDLTGAHLEDYYDEVIRFSQVTGVPTKEQYSAILTLAHQSMLAGGWQGSRDEARKLVRFLDMVQVTAAVAKALGFEAAADKGEG